MLLKNLAHANTCIAYGESQPGILITPAHLPDRKLDSAAFRSKF